MMRNRSAGVTGCNPNVIENRSDEIGYRNTATQLFKTFFESSTVLELGREFKER